MKKKSLPKYTKFLQANLSKSCDLKYAAVSLGDWQPSPKNCHDNVRIWCLYNSKYKPITGWLYFDKIGRFMAHSVVKAPDDYFYDITPIERQDTEAYPFIPTLESYKEFMAIVKASDGKIDIKSG